MALSQSKNTRVLFAKQSALGTIAASGASAKTARRASTSIAHTKNTFRSNEKRASGQVANEGHGQNLVSGDITGELYSGGAWEDFWAALLQRDFTGVTTIEASSGDGFTISSNVVTREGGGSGSFLDDGLRVGQIVRLTALTASADNNRNCLVTAVTALTATLAPIDGVALTNVGTADENATMVIPGQISYIPVASHTDDYFTVEDNKQDVDLSSVFYDVKVGRVQISVQPNQPVQLTWGFTGTGAVNDHETSAAPYFSSPAAAGNDVMFTSIRAYLRLNGVVIAIATSFNLTIDLALQAPEVIASTVSPEVFRGAYCEVTGDMNTFLKDHAIRTLFKDETEVELALVFEAPGSPKPFFSLFMPRVKVNSATPDDGDTGRMQQVNIRGLEKATTTGYEATSIMIQDSALS